MLFLFVEHAFDVGDLLELEAVQYRVKKIDLMFIVRTGARPLRPHCWALHCLHPRHAAESVEAVIAAVLCVSWLPP